MKTLIGLLLCFVLSNVAYAQKKNIDYQYYREGKVYYAFSLFKVADNGNTDELQLDFTTKAKFNKVEKISVKAGAIELKLKFKIREETVKSDNPEQKFYPIVFNSKDITDKNLGCEAQITFKLDNGESYTLPFNACLIK